MSHSPNNLKRQYFDELCDDVYFWLTQCQPDASQSMGLSAEWERIEMRRLENGNIVFELVKREPAQPKPPNIGF